MASVDSAINKIARMVAAADKQSLLDHYDVAAAIERVYATGSYGGNIVARIGAQLAWTERKVYQYIGVARAWTPAEFRQEVNRRNAQDLPLSWSHFALAAPIHKALRDQYLEYARVSCCTVNALHQKIKCELRRQRRGPGVTPQKQDVRDYLRVVVAAGLKPKAPAGDRETLRNAALFLIDHAPASVLTAYATQHLSGALP